MTKLINIDDIIGRLTTNNSELTALIFDASQEIDLEDLQKIISALKNNTSVTYVSFLDNHLTPEHIQLIGSIECQSLVRLSLQNNNISDSDLGDLLKIKTLQEMNLSYNKIQDAGAVLLASHPNLIELNVSYNRIGHEGMSALITSNTLHRLFAEHNPVDASISEFVFANTALKNIQLRNKMIDRTLQHRFNVHTGSNSTGRGKASEIGLLSSTQQRTIDEQGGKMKKDNGQSGCNIS